MYKNVNGKLIEMTEAEISEEKQKIQLAKAEEKSRHLTAEEVTAMLIRQQINGLTVEDNMALRMTEFYPEWAAGMDYATGYKVQHGGILYKCVQAHTSQADWTPDATPALWVVVSIDEYPEWVQPTGAHDAYNTGDKVSYNGKHYISTIDANTYAPDVYGWEATL